MYRNPVLTTDGIVLIDDRLVLIKRGHEPGKGSWALPGGIVEYGETTERCVEREIEEETGLRTKILDLIGVYSDQSRDPRGHFISVLYHLKKIDGDLKGGDDADKANLFSIDQLPVLAFDHAQMIRDFLASKRMLVRSL